MQIISGTTQFHNERPCALAIGKFDGVHLGHRRILEDLEKQRENGLITAVFTFDPSPEVYFGFDKSGCLTTTEEKEKILEALGIDLVIEFPFNKETAATDPERFIREYLVERLNVKYCAAGSDLSFGDGGRGNYQLLSYLSDRYEYETKMVKKVEKNGNTISSTLIRDCIEKGNMEEAAEYLGMPYSICGEVVHGKQLGRTIGIPTLNIIPPKGKCLPPFGVYYSDVYIEGEIFKGMTNIGIRPSVDDGTGITAETYLYDFNRDIYGKRAEVCLKTFRRHEMRFSSVDELRETMSADIAAGRSYHGIE